MKSVLQKLWHHNCQMFTLKWYCCWDYNRYNSTSPLTRKSSCQTWRLWSACRERKTNHWMDSNRSKKNLQLFVGETPPVCRSEPAHLGHLFVAEQGNLHVTTTHWTTAVRKGRVTSLQSFDECSAAPKLSVPPLPPTAPSGLTRTLPQDIPPSCPAHANPVWVGVYL